MAAISARYFRLYCYDAAASYYRLGEIEIHAVAGGPNICTGGTPFGNSDYFPASRAFDGSIVGDGACWAGNPGNGRTVGYDFGSTVTMAELVVINATSVGGGAAQHVFAFDFQYSEDGSVWNTVFSVPAAARASTEGASYSYGLETFVLSGVVQDAAGDPAAREVIAVREDTDVVVGRAISDAGSGAYSITVPADIKYTLVAYPADGEDLPALVLRGVEPA